MKRSLVLTVSILLISSASSLARQPVPDGDAPRTITTTGEAVVYVVPDELVVGFGVETYDPALKAAKDHNAAESARLLKAVREAGVEDKHVQTSDMEVELRYKDRARESAEVEGYIVRRTYAVTLKDVKKFEQLVSAALENGANRLLGFEHRTTELRKHRDEARKMAIRAAKEKAEALAGELDCTVGRPRTIGEGYFGYVGSWGSRWGYGRGQHMSQNVAQSAPGEGEGGETTPLGQIGVRASITVTFDLAG